MSYTVQYSNPGKDPLTIADGGVNNSTSLGLVGRNSSGYGQIISEDLLHLLENFAYEVAPSRPVEGQIWYDTSQPYNKVLRVYDGASWFPINGVHQASNSPVNKKVGDIWVDTASSQMFIWNGSTWLLIGPEITSGGRNGIYPTTLIDDQGEAAQSHQVVLTYINDEVITIVAKEAFTPNPAIVGFAELVPGLNVSTQSFSGVTAKLGGLANTALSLKVSDSAEPISADNFVRADTAGKINGFLAINSNAGIRIGAVTQTVLLEKVGNNAVLSNRTDSGKIELSIIKGSTLNSIVIVDGLNLRVGINHPNPQQTLDVVGSAKFTGTLTIATAVSNSIYSQGGIIAQGGIQIGGTTNVAGTSTFRGTVTVGYVGSVGAGIVGAEANKWDLGSLSNPFRTVYANNFSTTSTAFSMVATGMILLNAATGIPDGWLVCSGQEVAIATYPRLFSVIQNTYGIPSSVGAFVIPDLDTVATTNPSSQALNYIIKY